jgi:hypothetical protein
MKPNKSNRLFLTRAVIWLTESCTAGHRPNLGDAGSFGLEGAPIGGHNGDGMIARQQIWNLEENGGDVEIEPHDWNSFLDSFSRQHEGWLVSIKAASPGGKVMEVENRRLRAVGIGRSNGEQRAYVEVGDAQHGIVTHIADAPTNIRFKRTTTGEHEGLDIVSADGSTTLIRFRSAMLPEMLDDIAP